MWRKAQIVLPILVLVLLLAIPSLSMAEEVPAPTPTPTEAAPTPTPTVTPTPTPTATPLNIDAALASVTTAINALTATDEVKARLTAMAEGRLQEALDRGLTAEQLQEFADQIGLLLGQADLTRDLPHLNAACQLMLKGIKAGFTAAEVEAMISAKLAAGVDLKTALKETRFELKGKTPPQTGQNKPPKEKENGKDKEKDHGKKK